MSAETTGILILIALLSGAAAWFFSIRRRPAMQPVPIARTSTQQAPAVEALILGDVDNPLIEITPIDTQPMSRPIEATAYIKDALQPLLQRAPEMLRIGSDMVRKTYRVAFSPAVTRSLKHGTLELVPSAHKLLPVARGVGKGKKFVAIGRVVEEGGVRFANIAAMGWQIAAMVTAQHFLEEINARLAGIERGIDDIRAWLENEKKGELGAAVDHLREYAGAISRGQLNPHETTAIYNDLLALARQSNAIGKLAREMARHRLAELENINVREWMARSGSAERAIKWIKHNREVLELIFLAQSVRVLACQVAAMLPGDRQRLNERIENAKQEMREAQRLFDATREALLAKVSELRKRDDSLLAAWGILDKDRRSGIEVEFAIAREYVAQAVQRLEKDSASALDLSGRLEKLADSGMQIDVKCDTDGRIEIFNTASLS